MTKMVTRCPQCGTSFRITAAQLQTARGAVRCGACLHIFRGQEHLVGGDAPAAAPASVPTSTPTSKAATEAPGEQRLPFDQALIDAESGILDDDDFLIDDNMDQPPRADDELLDAASSQSTSSLFEREIKLPEDAPVDSADESWAMNLLAEEDQQDDVQVTPAKATEPTDPTFEHELQAPSAPADLPRTGLSGDELFTDELSPDELSTGDRSASEPTAETHIHFQLEPSGADDEQDYTGDRLQAYDSERTALLMGIDPEPVEMAWIPPGSRRRKLLWAGLALLGILLLVAQVAWLQFERLSRLDPYRGFYAAVCPLLGCELPILRDPSQIRAVNLVVRSHPEVDDALSVDAILLNNAPFEQPFPDLVLEFSNLEGEPLAVRRFTPEEYLSGELAGRTLIPRNQHVHLTLELVDPGPDAVSYRAYIPH